MNKGSLTFYLSFVQLFTHTKQIHQLTFLGKTQIVTLDMQQLNEYSTSSAFFKETTGAGPNKYPVLHNGSDLEGIWYWISVLPKYRKFLRFICISVHSESTTSFFLFCFCRKCRIYIIYTSPFKICFTIKKAFFF